MKPFGRSPAALAISVLLWGLTPGFICHLNAQTYLSNRSESSPASRTLIRPAVPTDPNLGYTPRPYLVWDAPLKEAGLSSPRLADLNGDGIEDVVIGSGAEAGQHGRKILALDGHTGEPLWEHRVFSRVFATPLPVDVNGDGTEDIIVGTGNNPVTGLLDELGREFSREVTGHLTELTGDLIALDGRTGERLWSLRRSNPQRAFANTNFNTAVPLPDLDGDGIADLLAIQSGGRDDERPPGIYFVVGSARGNILEAHSAPDRKEVYAVPAFEKRGDAHGRLVIGTGGETLPGHLMSLEFPSFRERWRFASRNKGFVGSPLLHDFTGSGVPDVITTSFEGGVYRINGKSGQVVWKIGNSEFETYSSPALGNFNNTPGLDVVAVFTQGTFPDYGRLAIVAWFDGKTGKAIASHKVGVQVSGSPLTADFNGDGFDETIIAANLGWELRHGTPLTSAVRSNLVIFDGKTKAHALNLEFQGFSGATPVITDLDFNGTPDILHAFAHHVIRIEVERLPTSRIRWGEYRGRHRNGVLERETNRTPFLR